MLADKITPFLEPSVFQEIRQWSIEYKSLDISSGKPNWKIPQFLREAMISAINENQDQYGMPGGLPELKQKIKEYIQPTIKTFEIDPNQNIYMGNGASGVIFDLIQVLLNPGEEVLFFDPHFPPYKACAKIFGGVVKTSKMIPPKNQEENWSIDFQDFENKFTEKTKILILCNPNNPTGKIYSEEEYRKIEQILLKFPNVVVISDEVYDFLVFDNLPYKRFADLSQDMAKRTVTVGSLGKTLSCTGWRSGFAIGNPLIIKALTASCANNFYCCFNPAQKALVTAVEEMQKPYKNEKSFLEYTRVNFQKNRDFMQQELMKLDNFNWQVLPAQGGYFILIDFEKMIPEVPLKYFYKEINQDKNEKCGVTYDKLEKPELGADVAFVKFLLENYKITGVPTQSFYNEPFNNNYLIRISLAKTPETLAQAIKQLQK